MLLPIICLSFFFIALLYASIGLGGGSAYLATMALFGVPKILFPAVALSCNSLVSSTSFFHYFKAGHFHWQNVFPFMVTSIPFAYIGGALEVSDFLFQLLLSMGLAAAGIVMVLKKESFQSKRSRRKHAGWMALLVGGVLGFLSGVIGIGGGIFLIPILLFLGWANSKEAAAAGACFILVNSMAGLAGHAVAGRIAIDWMWPVLLVTLAGGWIGGRIGSLRFSPLIVQRMAGGVIFFVALKVGRAFF